MLLASNLINVENVYLNFVSIRISLPSGSRATIFLFFFSYLSTSDTSAAIFGFLQIISFQHNQNNSYHFAARWPWRKLFVWFFILLSTKQKNLRWYFSQFTSIVAKKSRCYWCLCTVLSVDYANMPRLLTKLSLFFANFSSFWLEAFVTEIREEMSLKRCVTRQSWIIWTITKFLKLTSAWFCMTSITRSD